MHQPFVQGDLFRALDVIEANAHSLIADRIDDLAFALEPLASGHGCQFDNRSGIKRRGGPHMTTGVAKISGLGYDLLA